MTNQLDKLISRTLVSEATSPDPTGMRDCVLNIIAAMTENGFPPDFAAISTREKSSGFVRFSAAIAEAIDSRWSQVSELTITSSLHASQWPALEWNWALVALPSERVFVLAYLENEQLSQYCAERADWVQAGSSLLPQYGYEFRQRLSSGPLVYAIGGMTLGTRANRLPQREAITDTTWPRDRMLALRHGLLRDVFPVNLLTRKHLCASLGESDESLETWILQSPSHGTLLPLRDGLSCWRPPTDGIPAIREHLYSQGRLYHWRQFDPTVPQYRPDLSAPWEAPDPIPEIFRADFYKDKDPGLTL